MARKKRRYSDEFRASAVLMLQAAGYPETKGALAAVSQKLNVPHATLNRWFNGIRNPAPSEVVQVKKEDIVRLLMAEVYDAIKDLPNARPDADYRAIATAVGIMIDKVQLLDGAPTQRIQYDWRNELEDAGIDAGEAFEEMVNFFASRASGPGADDGGGVGGGEGAA